MGVPATQSKKTNTVIRKPVLKQPNEYECQITYFDGKKWVNTVKHNYSDINAINVFAGIRAALNSKNTNGVISREAAIKILQNVFEKGSDTVKRYGDRVDKQTGLLVAIKDLFELYMDKTSDGGENITQKEQFAIMRTLDNWY